MGILSIGIDIDEEEANPRYVIGLIRAADTQEELTTPLVRATLISRSGSTARGDSWETGFDIRAWGRCVLYLLHFCGGLRLWQPLGGEVTPWSPFEESAGVCGSYSKARSEPRNFWSHTLSPFILNKNTSQVAPGKSAELLIISKHLATHRPATALQLGLQNSRQGPISTRPVSSSRVQVVVLNRIGSALWAAGEVPLAEGTRIGCRIGCGMDGVDTIVAQLLDFPAPLRSKQYIVFVGARYKHVRCTNSNLRVLYSRDPPAK